MPSMPGNKALMSMKTYCNAWIPSERGPCPFGNAIEEEAGLRIPVTDIQFPAFFLSFGEIGFGSWDRSGGGVVHRNLVASLLVKMKAMKFLERTSCACIEKVGSTCAILLPLLRLPVRSSVVCVAYTFPFTKEESRNYAINAVASCARRAHVRDNTGSYVFAVLGSAEMAMVRIRTSRPGMLLPDHWRVLHLYSLHQLLVLSFLLLARTSMHCAVP
mmetsp:Transcript_33431/g.98549  ORF Transcript_33431/g.98549 Transcript_33431/m.98549 type:complete len:216 (-) Transcript_33431:1766-2413(-)